MLSGTASRITGSFVRPLRRLTQRKRNLTPHWIKSDQVPSGWANVPMQLPLARVANYFYTKLQLLGTRFSPGSTAQRALQAECHSYLNRAAAAHDKIAPT